MSVFRLIHLSDIHLTPFIAPSLMELCSKRITGWLNWKLSRSHAMGEQVLASLIADMQRQHHDHLVISGDLVNLSLKQEFIQARHWLEQLGAPHDISLTFGNHDAYVPGSLKCACQIFAPWIETDESGQANRGMAFPTCRLRGEVAIIGLNSACATRPFSARGTFRQQQAAQLAEILARTQGFFRVVVLHHPPIHGTVARHKILNGIDLFQQVIATQGAELILHGHSHEPTLHFIKGQKTQVPVVGVASASQGCHGHKPPANMNIFEIERGAEAWHCRLIRRTLVNDQGDFAETQSHTLSLPRFDKDRI